MHETELITNFNKLTQSLQDRIQKEIIDFCNLNDRLGDNRPYQCPYCHKKTKMIKKGFARGKQRYLCMDCYHKFTYDSHMITSFLKIDVDEFVEICINTLTMVPIHKTAKRLNRSIKCVFLNRHKFLSMLEKYLESEKIQLSGTIECDETYVLESSKGSSLKRRKARHRGEPSKFRGISHEQICIVTTTNRNEHEIFLAVGQSRPTKDIIQDTFKNNITQRSIIYTDGTDCYNLLAECKNCKVVHLKGHQSYNQVEHLNVVNHIYSIIKNKLAQYRGVAAKYINRYTALFVCMRRFMEMDINELYEKLAWMIRYPFAITTKALRNHNLFSFSLQE